MSRNKCEGIQFFIIFFLRTKEFNFKVMLKVPNSVFSWRKNFYNFERQLNPTHLHSMTKYCQWLFNVFVSKPVWHCIVSFHTVRSSSWLKWTCLIDSYHHLIPANSYFYVNNVDLLKEILLYLIDASQNFFHYQREKSKQPRPQSNLKKVALTPHDELIWFVDCS